MRFKSLFCLFLLLIINFFSFSRVLIWDFGGITFNPDKLGVAQHIGLSYFLSYMFFDFRNPNIQKMLFTFLSKLEKADPNNNSRPAGTAEGMPLPPIMCRWQAGTITGPQIIKIANKAIEHFTKIGYFKSKRERELVKRTINSMFNPMVLARNVYPVKEGIELLKECTAALDYKGKKRNINIAFSNWDPLSFDIFYKLNKDSFKYFDEIVISGHIGLIKPHKEAYNYVIKKFNLNPQDCILIDDQVINAIGAKQCGIKTILLKNWNYKKLRKQLIMNGALLASEK